MVRVIVVLREIGSSEVAETLHFELPEVPREGNYISISRPDKREPISDDFIVRHVWWRLHHTQMGAPSDPPRSGNVTEIFVECDPAVGPYASDAALEMIERAKSRGLDVPEFDVSRRPVI